MNKEGGRRDGDSGEALEVVETKSLRQGGNQVEGTRGGTQLQLRLNPIEKFLNGRRPGFI